MKRVALRYLLPVGLCFLGFGKANDNLVQVELNAGDMRVDEGAIINWPLHVQVLPH
jgi:hypothetical protein